MVASEAGAAPGPVKLGETGRRIGAILSTAEVDIVRRCEVS